MSRRWPAPAKRSSPAARHDGRVHAHYIDGVTIRPLRNGDAASIAALFARLGPRSRAQRFGGAKPRLSAQELQALARVDGEHHVLVAYLAGDPHPAGMVRLVRDHSEAEVACEVADAYQGRGIGSVLAREMAADARAAGITELRATVSGHNPRAVSLLALCARSLDVRWHGGQRDFTAGLER
jgi:ribosomal protein S18 acetylase RimI-like enzyme